jgi:2-polyprenyl-3-methyl-5-hydroxy-6-metoxy-1,4-benzoquinol methylase
MNRIDPSDETRSRETRFHDGWALNQDLSRVRVREVFESPVAMENRFILRKMGPLQGKSVLDIGPGLGESSVYFAMQGAQVTVLDLSPRMVEFARRLARQFHVKIHGVVGSAEDLGERSRYDIVYAANLLHHLSDREAFFRQVHQALLPGGHFFSIDPLRYSPAINAYRRMATKVRTEDERPLGFEDFALAHKYFVNAGHREFWIFTQALFLKYFLVDGVHPNQDRYWKRIFNESPGSLWWWYPLRFADGFATRLPLLRRLAWNMVLWGQKGIRPA